MSSNLTRSEIIVGSLHCAVHASHLITDAAALYRVGRASSSFLLAVTAREELGKHYILLKEANLVSIDASVSVTAIQSAIRPSKLPHQVKLAAGQSTFQVSASLPKETFSERQVRYAQMRKIDADALHQERMTAQYVDLEDDGTWSLPVGLRNDTAHHLILTVACEVADPLRWVPDDPEASALANSLVPRMPDAEAFLREVELLLRPNAGA
jgi:AbiV family abortive infection protein